MAPVKKAKKKASPPRAARKTTVHKKITKAPARKVKAARTAVKRSSSRTFARAEYKVIGSVVHYFPKVRVAVVNLKSPLALGDRIKIKGHTTDFTQGVTSLQIDRVPLKQAKKGDVVGLLVDSRVRRHDVVSKA